MIDFKLHFDTEQEQDDFYELAPRYSDVGIYMNKAMPNVIKLTVYLREPEVNLSTIRSIEDIFKTYIEKLIEAVNKRIEINNIVKDLEPFIIG